MNHLHPRAFFLFLKEVFGISFLFSLLVFIAIFLLGIYIGNARPTGVFPLITLFAIPAVYVGFLLLWAKLLYRSCRFELTDNEFKEEWGVIWKKYISIPYAGIQSTDIKRGLLCRLFGISEVYIHTAGGRKSIWRWHRGYTPYLDRADAVLPGFLTDDAERFRDELIRRAGMFPDAAR